MIEDWEIVEYAHVAYGYEFAMRLENLFSEKPSRFQEFVRQSMSQEIMKLPVKK